MPGERCAASVGAVHLRLSSHAVAPSHCGTLDRAGLAPVADEVVPEPSDVEEEGLV